MGDLIERDKIYEAVYDLACKSAGVIGGISEDYAYGLREAAHMIEEAPAVDAVPMTHDLDSSDLIRRKDVLWITKETGAWETQNRVRELPAVDAAPVMHGEWIKRNKYDMESRLYCSSCKQEYDYFDGIYYIVSGSELPFYCPNCGAKMNVEGDAE